MSRTVRVLWAIVASFLISFPITANAAPSTAAIKAAVAERAAFGLPSDYSTVEALLASGLDVGTPRWGIPMTAEEEETVDLPSRMTFAGYAQSAIPFAQQLPDFAGLYFDQTHGGKLVVMLVGHGHEAEQAIIADLLPSEGPGVEFRTAEYTFAQLESAWSAADEAWKSDTRLLAATIDVRANMVWLGVSEGDIAATAGMADEMGELLGVPVGIRVAESTEELACTDREHCTNPMKAGNVVRNDSENGPRCTMGFHVTGEGGNRQFVTAGHCGYQQPIDWYHKGMPGNGFIGNRISNLYASHGVDIVRVNMPDSQVSKAIWGSAWLVEFARAPNTGEAICASLGVSNLVDCGTVATAFASWTGGGCGCQQQGAQASGLNGIPGDSGSPIYAIFNQQDVALGSLSTDIYFAEIQDALNVWGDWKVYGT